MRKIIRKTQRALSINLFNDHQRKSNHWWASRAEELKTYKNTAGHAAARPGGRAVRAAVLRQREPGRNNGHGVKPVAVGHGSQLDGKEKECVIIVTSNESRAMKKSQRRIILNYLLLMGNERKTLEVRI
jgi:hypothetical protein